MKISLCVPFRGGNGRDRVWTYLRARYERLWPQFEIVVRDSEGPWCKGKAVNDAVEASSGDVLIVADADVMVSPECIQMAVGVLDQSSWVMPHERVWRMNEETTNRLLSGQMDDTIRPLGATEISAFPRYATQGGGLFVISREKWIPMDERFIEWGGEDISQGRCLDSLIGHHRTLPYDLWHLHHEPSEMRSGRRALRQESEDLANRYYAATTSRDEMQAIVNEYYEPSY